MNYEIACNPIPAADLPGYTFRRDQNGAVIARCTVCRVGFTVRETNGEAVRYAMAMHRDFSHGCGARGEAFETHRRATRRDLSGHGTRPDRNEPCQP